MNGDIEEFGQRRVELAVPKHPVTRTGDTGVGEELIRTRVFHKRRPHRYLHVTDNPPAIRLYDVDHSSWRSLAIIVANLLSGVDRFARSDVEETADSAA